MFWILHILGLIACAHAAPNKGTIKGPPIVSQRNVFTVGRLGDDVRLICPMEGNPAPMIDWFKGEEKIDHFWTRFKPNRRNLRIRDATTADSGRFYCRGVNGFGSEQVSIDLIVIDPAEFPELPEGQLPDISPPELAMETVTAREEFEKKQGDVITVSCTITGRPTPLISWFKNGVELIDNIETSGVTSMLRIRNLRVEDSGTYTCAGRNMAGDVRKDYRLTVRNTLLENPVFYNTPTNQTVAQGETASLDCRVQSALPPTIKWLKKLDPEETFRDVEVISVGKESYRIIDRYGAEPSMRRSPSSEVYTSQLELVNVKVQDSGMYICFVTNSMGGFNYKPAYLTVRSANETVFESPLVLAISISLAGVTLFILGGLLVCLVRNRNKKPEQECGEVRSTLICPPAPPPSIQDTLYSKSGHPLPPPPTPQPQWSMLYGHTGQTSYTDSSQYGGMGGGGNTYEVPRYSDRTTYNQRVSPAGQPSYVYGGYRQNDMY